jgi:hypothetical protein
MELRAVERRSLVAQTLREVVFQRVARIAENFDGRQIDEGPSRNGERDENEVGTGRLDGAGTVRARKLYRDTLTSHVAGDIVQRLTPTKRLLK